MFVLIFLLESEKASEEMTKSSLDEKLAELRGELEEMFGRELVKMKQQMQETHAMEMKRSKRDIEHLTDAKARLEKDVRLQLHSE